MHKKTILVTGGAGYIGSHACKALSLAGYTPVAFDNLSRGREFLVKWGPFVKGDVTDAACLDEVFRRYQPTAVLHFAAFAYVGESMQDPSIYYRNNVYGSLVLLDTMKRHGVDKIIFSSTCNTYGEPLAIPLNETHAQRPINPYGQSKFMVERILADFDKGYGIRSVSLRYFNAAGADPEGETGEVHDPETHLIPLVFDVAVGRAVAIRIFGDDYPTEDGTCIRDYIHVTDLAAAHLLALQALERGAASVAYNLGNGLGHSVKEVIRAAEKVTGKGVRIEIAPRRAGDSDRLISDSTRVAAELGWRPEFVEIETILEHAWNWYIKMHGNR